MTQVYETLGSEVLECYYCKGRMVRGKTTYTINKQGYHLLLDNVAAWVCQQCGEAYFEEKEVDAIQDLTKALDSKIIDIRIY